VGADMQAVEADTAVVEAVRTSVAEAVIRVDSPAAVIRVAAFPAAAFPAADMPPALARR